MENEGVECRILNMFFKNRNNFNFMDLTATLIFWKIKHFRKMKAVAKFHFIGSNQSMNNVESYYA